LHSAARFRHSGLVIASTSGLLVQHPENITALACAMQYSLLRCPVRAGCAGLAELGAVTKPTVRLGVKVVGLLRFGGNGKPGYGNNEGPT
jgi:hypothetical protein